jgi:hypothetical protein
LLCKPAKLFEWRRVAFTPKLVFRKPHSQWVLALPTKARILCLDLLNNNRPIFIWGFSKDDILACVETWD